ncbi:MAG TPA: translation elongation factor Ts [Longimicrobiales bacterium]|nr:translation elongation factor Ts [Longimicrobiales bacterium]
MAISAGQVKELRERTGAGMMDCKKALEESGGDMEAAIDLLRSRGTAKAAKRAGKEATEGAVGLHIDEAAGVGALVEVACETDFVARTDDFQGLASQLAEHVATESKETDGEGTGDALLEQSLRGGDRTVGEQITEVSAKTGERIVVGRFARFDAAGGPVSGYVHLTGKIGVLVELEGAVDGTVARDVAMHIAATRPLSVKAEDIPAEVVERERAVYLEQVRNEGKPEEIQAKIVEGKLKRFFKESTLLEQPFVKDPDRTVKALLGDASVRRFVRYELGAE